MTPAYTIPVAPGLLATVRPTAASRLTVRPSPPLHGDCVVPGDKSISHRAVILGGIATGLSRVRGFLYGADCQATLLALTALGCVIEFGAAREPEIVIHGRGLHGLREPSAPLDCQNSGTTMRLLTGLLAGQQFASFLVGSPQLCQRPMERVVRPLRQMGAQLIGREGGRLAPLALAGCGERPLSGLAYELPVASAQVKSCLLLAGLYADAAVSVHEPAATRDHSERMLRNMGARIERTGDVVTIHPTPELQPLTLTVPGDASAAAFLLVAAAIVSGSELTVRGVGINPTRSGLWSTLGTMGAEISVENPRESAGEPVADLRLRQRALSAAYCRGPNVVTMIDEIPILAVAATQARGRTVIADASELRVKETDRIAATAAELRKLGADITPTQDGLIIVGPTRLRGAAVSSRGDHRLAMALCVAGLVATGETTIDGAEVTADSFPGFSATLRSLGADLTETGPVIAATWSASD
ncbi:MAG: 3-phosphoshikimate 1-carboxyvinyltransferase [Myxococcales bacterium]|jgi:3-phosphoshikimate 1-carboxyvinyltransferase|nr:3-phosphoshikimate 1-carboxyvinyltransferase [Myxococcales bacterium]